MDGLSYLNLIGKQRAAGVPEWDLSRLVDLEGLKDLLERFSAATGVAAALMDRQENMLVTAGWKDICTGFHRQHPEAASSCAESDAYIKEKIRAAAEVPSSQYVGPAEVYHCKNGLVDMAVPIFIEGQHVATFFLGQFLFEAPDREWFRRQARQWGLDEEAYLQALERVPVVSEERAHNLLDFASYFAHFLATLGLQRWRELETARELETQEKTIRDILGSLEEVVWSTDLEGNLMYLNPAAEQVYGRSMSDLISDPHYWINSVHPEDRARVLETRGQLRVGHPVRCEYRIVRPAGEVRWLADRLEVIGDSQGKPLRVDGIAQDVTDRRRWQARLYYLSFHDQLTGLYNRAFFEEELRRLDSPRQLPLSILVGDVNGLKLVNDAFGHQTGDQLLQRVARILRESCRQEDIVARWGGDEFALLLPQTPEDVAWGICRRINRACAHDSQHPIPVSLSLAAAAKVWEEDDIDRVLGEAEERMYRTKMLEAKSARGSIMNTLQKTLAEKTHETEEHAFRMQSYSTRVGNAMGLSLNQLDELVLLAGLHDIGKIAVPEHILNKPGRLEPQEWEEVKKHCEAGYRISQSVPELAPVSEYILSHHERWDGSGYPRGLRQDEIPLLSRIVSVVDAFDVMVHGRPYQQAKTIAEARDELERCAGSQFDPRVVDAFVPLLTSGAL